MLTDPSLHFFCEALVEIGEAQELGPCPSGTRRFVPVTGGRFWGEGFEARVLAGGGDWQVIQPDGVVEIDTRYTLETHDGYLIYLQNTGIRHQYDGPYMRTFSRFETTEGPYAWVNHRLFISTGSKGPEGIRHQFYQIC